MAQDRLAALRAQRQQQPPAAGPGGYEMQSVNTPQYANGGGQNNGGDSMGSFMSEVASIQDGIQQFDGNINRISDLHSRSLNTLDESASQQNSAQLDELAEDTRQLSNSLSKRIKALGTSVKGGGQEAQIRKNQIEHVRAKFVETLQRYQEVERQYRARYKQRVERQFKIVKPEATPEEVAAVVNDDQDGGGQIFAQALTTSNRYGESRAAYREVQERHQDIKRIETTLAELAQLFNDMAVLVDQQEIQIDHIHDTAAEVDVETGGALKHTETAVKSARAARRKKWICFWITVIVILAAIGIGVGVYFSNHPPGKSSSSSSGNSTSS